MKKDRTFIFFIIVSSFLQGIFFKYISVKEIPMVFLLGITPKEVSSFPYLEFCVLSIPIYYITLYFSDYFSFYMENYGKVLLVRNCKKTKMLLKIYFKVAVKLFFFTIIQNLIHAICFSDFLMVHYNLVLKAVGIYYLVMFFVISLEIFLCTILKDHIAHISINIYGWISFLIYWISENGCLKKIFLPGQLINIKTFLKSMNTEIDFLKKNVYMISMICIICIFTIIRCRKKDVF